MISVISAVVRARNAASDLKVLLPRLRAQRLPTGIDALQIIVVDNESDDNTRQVASDYDAEICGITVAEFTWGRALNVGIGAARGELVVIISADVRPVGENWLLDICKPFSESDVGAVYGRQVPRQSAPLDEWVRVFRTFPPYDRSWSGADVQNCQVQGLVASNACVVIRRSLWVQFQYDEESHGAEELPWTCSVLQAGFRVLYIAEPLAEHSHRDSAMKQALRLWELEMERHRDRGSSMHIADAVRAIGAFVKRRIRNLFESGAGIGRRLESILSLPAEIAALAMVSMSTICGVDYATIRKRW